MPRNAFHWLPAEPWRSHSHGGNTYIALERPARKPRIELKGCAPTSKERFTTHKAPIVFESETHRAAIRPVPGPARHCKILRRARPPRATEWRRASRRPVPEHPIGPLALPLPERGRRRYRPPCFTARGCVPLRRPVTVVAARPCACWPRRCNLGPIPSSESAERCVALRPPWPISQGRVQRPAGTLVAFFFGLPPSMRRLSARPRPGRVRRPRRGGRPWVGLSVEHCWTFVPGNFRHSRFRAPIRIRSAGPGSSGLLLFARACGPSARPAPFRWSRP